MRKTEYTMKDLFMAKEYLIIVFKNVIPKSFALLGFENDFVVRHQSNTIITIIQKIERYKIKKRKRYVKKHY